jgi:hypothetical protein
MKKTLLFPALGLLSVALFAFKAPAPSASGKIIHCEDGTDIIPSSVPVSLDDQRKIVAVLSSHGDDYGYAFYTEKSGERYVYHPTPVDELLAIDKAYGSDLSSSSAAFGFWLYRKSETTETRFKEYTLGGSSLTLAIQADLAPILSKYE